MRNEYLNNHVFESVIEKYQKSARDRIKYELLIEDFTEPFGKVNKKKQEDREIKIKTIKEQYKKSLAECKHNEQELSKAFYTLTEEILKWKKFSLIDEDDAVQDGVLTCYEKVDRFDSAKGKAFNYLTTCVLNQFKQLWRSARNYNELKIRYQDFLCSSFEDSVARNLREKLKNYRANEAANDNTTDGTYYK